MLQGVDADVGRQIDIFAHLQSATSIQYGIISYYSAPQITKSSGARSSVLKWKTTSWATFAPNNLYINFLKCMDGTTLTLKSIYLLQPPLMTYFSQIRYGEDNK